MNDAILKCPHCGSHYDGFQFVECPTCFPAEPTCTCAISGTENCAYHHYGDHPQPATKLCPECGASPVSEHEVWCKRPLTKVSPCEGGGETLGQIYNLEAQLKSKIIALQNDVVAANKGAKNNALINRAVREQLAASNAVRGKLANALTEADCCLRDCGVTSTSVIRSIIDAALASHREGKSCSLVEAPVKRKPV